MVARSWARPGRGARNEDDDGPTKLRQNPGADAARVRAFRSPPRPRAAATARDPGVRRRRAADAADHGRPVLQAALAAAPAPGRDRHGGRAAFAGGAGAG